MGVRSLASAGECRRWGLGWRTCVFVARALAKRDITFGGLLLFRCWRRQQPLPFELGERRCGAAVRNKSEWSAVARRPQVASHFAPGIHLVSACPILGSPPCLGTPKSTAQQGKGRSVRPCINRLATWSPAPMMAYHLAARWSPHVCRQTGCRTRLGAARGNFVPQAVFATHLFLQVDGP